MYVKIGPYRNWLGPYQIAEKLLFWLDKYEDDRVHKFGEWLAGSPKKPTILAKVCNWIHDKKHRKIKVKIHNYDTWGMDNTLAFIILPMLKQLKATKHGAPFTDDEDVPDELKSTSAPPKEHEYDTDDNHSKRWDWILDEMIQAFECKVDDGWEEKYWEGKYSDDWMVELDLDKPSGRTCDWDALKAHQKRNSNGYRLFGKYLEGLWD